MAVLAVGASPQLSFTTQGVRTERTIETTQAVRLYRRPGCSIALSPLECYSMLGVAESTTPCLSDSAYIGK